MLVTASVGLWRRTKRRGQLEEGSITRFQGIFNVLVQLLIAAGSFRGVNVATANDVQIGGGEVDRVINGVDFAERKVLRVS